MTSVTLSLTRVRDFQSLGRIWRELEERADGSFFQGWTWTGCLAEERFSDPILLEARIGPEVVALALFNRRRDRLGRERLHLGESGDPALDCPYIEHNGVLVARGQPGDLAGRCLAAARRLPLEGRRPWLPRAIVASGVPEPLVQACGGRILRSQRGWRADLGAVRRGGGCYLASRSPNTRQQLRRSARALAVHGPLTVARPRDAAEAMVFLAGLESLHQARWQARGRPGAFAPPFFGRFHRALVGRGWDRGEVRICRLSINGTNVAFLYNFRYRDTVLAYQSGFAELAGGAALKPGYTAHALEIRCCVEAGAETYDFLAGDSRYKRSLGDSSYMLHWVGPGAWFPGADRLVAVVRQAVQGKRSAVNSESNQDV